MKRTFQDRIYGAAADLKFKNSLEPLVLLSLLTKGWDNGDVPPYPIYAMLGIEPRSLVF